MLDERASLIARMLVAAPWLDEARAAALLDGTQEERELVVASHATAAVTEGPEVWQQLLTVLAAAAGVASAVSGISSAVTNVYALRTL